VETQAMIYNTRRSITVFAPVLLALGGAALATPAQAQERMPILVPIFANSAGERGNFGKDVAKEFRKLLEDFPTHRPVADKDINDKLKSFGLKEEALMDAGNDCVQAQQMTVHVAADLVLCGQWREVSKDNYQISAKVVAPGDDTYEMQSFQAENPKDAAQKLLTEFGEFTMGLRIAVYCQEAVGREDWADGIAKCTEALQINPQSKNAAYNLGSSHWRSGDPDQARQMFEKVLEIDPTYDDAILALGLIAAEQGRDEDATRHFHEYLTFNPGNVAVRLSIATEAAQAGGYVVALQIVEDGMADTEGEDLVALKEFAGAVAMNAAVREMNDSGNTAEVGAARPIVEKGLTYLEDVYAAKGAEIDVTSLRNMFTAYRLLDQNDKAVELGRMAVEHHADDPSIWSNYADALNRANNTAEALTALDRVAALDPQYANLYARKALWILASGDLEGAAAAALAGLQNNAIDPEQVDRIAQQITNAGYQDRVRTNNDFAGAMPYYDTAEKIAQTPETKAMIAFFRGYSVYQLAVEREKPNTLESARSTLPQFQRVVALMQAASVYTEGKPLENNRQEILRGANDYIEIQQLIINRGR
jgi:tetratricopeptide (TPR) repeat protein